MRAKGFGAGADSGGYSHSGREINVFALNIPLATPVDGFARSRLVERILQRADVHLGPIEVGQMQDGGTDFVENVLSLTPVAHPRGPTPARMALIHFSSH